MVSRLIWENRRLICQKLTAFTNILVHGALSWFAVAALCSLSRSFEELLLLPRFGMLLFFSPRPLWLPGMHQFRV